MARLPPGGGSSPPRPLGPAIGSGSALASALAGANLSRASRRSRALRRPFCESVAASASRALRRPFREFVAASRRSRALRRPFCFDAQLSGQLGRWGEAECLFLLLAKQLSCRVSNFCRPFALLCFSPSYQSSRTCQRRARRRIAGVARAPPPSQPFPAGERLLQEYFL